MIQYEPASFKDPAGRVFYADGFVYRSLSPAARETFQQASTASLLDTLAAERLILPAELVPAEAAGADARQVGPSVLRQRRVPFVSYSYEWSFEMLRDAALATLRVQETALEHGFTLKDGNAFNVLFDGMWPKLVDVLSLEPYREGTIWAGYGQFCRAFLFPLLIASYRGIDMRPQLRARLGEISAVDASRFFSVGDWIKGGVLRDVVVQAQLERSFAGSQRGVRAAAAGASLPRKALLRSVNRLQSIVAGLSAPPGSAAWAQYETVNTYDASDRTAKATFVRRALESRPRRRVVDLGSNTGEYSLAALAAAEHVISLDIDGGVIDRLYRRGADRARQSPVVADLLNPTPALGWALEERRSLFDRLDCDGFLALGLVHHLRITGGVPFAMILRQLLRIAPEGVVEWIDREDPMVRQMLALRADVYDDFAWPEFERLLRSEADLVAVETINAGTRRLCHVRPK